jgi:hypothetical protein
MMQVSLDRTLVLLIDYKGIMFSFIDYMDEKQRKDIPEEIFTNIMLAKLKKIISKQEAERLKDAFDLKNLEKIGVISELNRSRGTLAFQPAIIEIFRMFDKERIRGLCSPELEDIRVRLENTYHQHKELIFDDDNPDFFEQKDHLFNLLREINSKIQNNTIHLQHTADRLSNKLDYNQAVLTLDESQQIKEILRQVKQIYDREIIPILEFLNTREYSKNKAALTLIDDISRLYDLNGYEDNSYHIGQYKLSILTHYKSIEKVKQTLQRYIYQERKHRFTYNAIEQAYIQLQNLAQETFTENLKDKYIFKSISQDELYFKGLKSYSSAQEARVEWNERNHAMYFKEYLIEQKARKRSNNEAKITTTEGVKNCNKNNILKRNIRKIIHSCKIKPPNDDIYMEIHSFLSDKLPKDYQLQYLLYGVSCFKKKYIDKGSIKTSFEKPQRKIQYKGKVLEYNKREFTL